MKLGQFSQALQAFTQALESLAKADLDEKKLATWKKDLAKKMEGCQGKADVGESGRSPFGHFSFRRLCLLYIKCVRILCI